MPSRKGTGSKGSWNKNNKRNKKGGYRSKGGHNANWDQVNSDTEHGERLEDEALRQAETNVRFQKAKAKQKRERIPKKQARRKANRLGRKATNYSAARMNRNHLNAKKQTSTEFVQRFINIIRQTAHERSKGISINNKIYDIINGCVSDSHHNTLINQHAMNAIDQFSCIFLGGVVSATVLRNRYALSTQVDNGKQPIRAIANQHIAFMKGYIATFLGSFAAAADMSKDVTEIDFLAQPRFDKVLIIYNHHAYQRLIVIETPGLEFANPLPRGCIHLRQAYALLEISEEGIPTGRVGSIEWLKSKWDDPNMLLKLSQLEVAVILVPFMVKHEDIIVGVRIMPQTNDSSADKHIRNVTLHNLPNTHKILTYDSELANGAHNIILYACNNVIQLADVGLNIYGRTADDGSVVTSDYVEVVKRDPLWTLMFNLDIDSIGNDINTTVLQDQTVEVVKSFTVVKLGKGENPIRRFLDYYLRCIREGPLRLNDCWVSYWSSQLGVNKSLLMTNDLSPEEINILTDAVSSLYRKIRENDLKYTMMHKSKQENKERLALRAARKARKQLDAQTNMGRTLADGTRSGVIIKYPPDGIVASMRKNVVFKQSFVVFRRVQVYGVVYGNVISDTIFEFANKQTSIQLPGGAFDPNSDDTNITVWKEGLKSSPGFADYNQLRFLALQGYAVAKWMNIPSTNPDSKKSMSIPVDIYPILQLTDFSYSRGTERGGKREQNVVVQIDSKDRSKWFGIANVSFFTNTGPFSSNFVKSDSESYVAGREHLDVPHINYLSPDFLLNEMRKREIKDFDQIMLPSCILLKGVFCYNIKNAKACFLPPDTLGTRLTMGSHVVTKLAYDISKISPIDKPGHRGFTHELKMWSVKFYILCDSTPLSFFKYFCSKKKVKKIRLGTTQTHDMSLADNHDSGVCAICNKKQSLTNIRCVKCKTESIFTETCVLPLHDEKSNLVSVPIKEWNYPSGYSCISFMDTLKLTLSSSDEFIEASKLVISMIAFIFNVDDTHVNGNVVGDVTFRHILKLFSDWLRKVVCHSFIVGLDIHPGLWISNFINYTNNRRAATRLINTVGAFSPDSSIALNAHTCGICNKTFNTEMDLAQHETIHNRESMRIVDNQTERFCKIARSAAVNLSNRVGRILKSVIKIGDQSHGTIVLKKFSGILQSLCLTLAPFIHACNTLSNALIGGYFVENALRLKSLKYEYMKQSDHIITATSAHFMNVYEEVRSHVRANPSLSSTNLLNFIWSSCIKHATKSITYSKLGKGRSRPCEQFIFAHWDLPIDSDLRILNLFANMAKSTPNPDVYRIFDKVRQFCPTSVEGFKQVTVSGDISNLSFYPIHLRHNTLHMDSSFLNVLYSKDKKCSINFVNSQPIDNSSTVVCDENSYKRILDNIDPRLRQIFCAVSSLDFSVDPFNLRNSILSSKLMNFLVKEDPDEALSMLGYYKPIFTTDIDYNKKLKETFELFYGKQLNTPFLYRGSLRDFTLSMFNGIQSGRRLCTFDDLVALHIIPDKQDSRHVSLQALSNRFKSKGNGGVSYFFKRQHPDYYHTFMNFVYDTYLNVNNELVFITKVLHAHKDYIITQINNDTSYRSRVDIYDLPTWDSFKIISEPMDRLDSDITIHSRYILSSSAYPTIYNTMLKCFLKSYFERGNFLDTGLGMMYMFGEPATLNMSNRSFGGSQSKVLKLKCSENMLASIERDIPTSDYNHRFAVYNNNSADGYTEVDEYTIVRFLNQAFDYGLNGAPFKLFVTYPLLIWLYSNRGTVTLSRQFVKGITPTQYKAITGQMRSMVRTCGFERPDDVTRLSTDDVQRFLVNAEKLRKVGTEEFFKHAKAMGDNYAARLMSTRKSAVMALGSKDWKIASNTEFQRIINKERAVLDRYYGVTNLIRTMSFNTDPSSAQFIYHGSGQTTEVRKWVFAATQYYRYCSENQPHLVTSVDFDSINEYIAELDNILSGLKSNGIIKIIYPTGISNRSQETANAKKWTEITRKDPEGTSDAKTVFTKRRSEGKYTITLTQEQEYALLISIYRERLQFRQRRFRSKTVIEGGVSMQTLGLRNRVRDGDSVTSNQTITSQRNIDVHQQYGVVRYLNNDGFPSVSLIGMTIIVIKDIKEQRATYVEEMVSTYNNKALHWTSSVRYNQCGSRLGVGNSILDFLSSIQPLNFIKLETLCTIAPNDIAERMIKKAYITNCSIGYFTTHLRSIAEKYEISESVDTSKFVHDVYGLIFYYYLISNHLLWRQIWYVPDSIQLLGQLFSGCDSYIVKYNMTFDTDSDEVDAINDVYNPVFISKIVSATRRAYDYLTPDGGVKLSAAITSPDTSVFDQTEYSPGIDGPGFLTVSGDLLFLLRDFEGGAFSDYNILTISEQTYQIDWVHACYDRKLNRITRDIEAFVVTYNLNALYVKYNEYVRVRRQLGEIANVADLAAAGNYTGGQGTDALKYTEADVFIKWWHMNNNDMSRTWLSRVLYAILKLIKKHYGYIDRIYRVLGKFAPRRKHKPTAQTVTDSWDFVGADPDDVEVDDNGPSYVPYDDTEDSLVSGVVLRNNGTFTLIDKIHNFTSRLIRSNSNNRWCPHANGPTTVEILKPTPLVHNGNQRVGFFVPHMDKVQLINKVLVSMYMTCVVGTDLRSQLYLNVIVNGLLLYSDNCNSMRPVLICNPKPTNASKGNSRYKASGNSIRYADGGVITMAKRAVHQITVAKTDEEYNRLKDTQTDLDEFYTIDRARVDRLRPAVDATRTHRGKLMRRMRKQSNTVGNILASTLLVGSLGGGNSTCVSGIASVHNGTQVVLLSDTLHMLHTGAEYDCLSTRFEYTDGTLRIYYDGLECYTFANPLIVENWMIGVLLGGDTISSLLYIILIIFLVLILMFCVCSRGWFPLLINYGVDLTYRSSSNAMEIIRHFTNRASTPWLNLGCDKQVFKLYGTPDINFHPPDSDYDIAISKNSVKNDGQNDLAHTDYIDGYMPGSGIRGIISGYTHIKYLSIEYNSPNTQVLTIERGTKSHYTIYFILCAIGIINFGDVPRSYKATSYRHNLTNINRLVASTGSDSDDTDSDTEP